MKHGKNTPHPSPTFNTNTSTSEAKDFEIRHGRNTPPAQPSTPPVYIKPQTNSR